MTEKERNDYLKAMETLLEVVHVITPRLIYVIKEIEIKLNKVIDLL